MEPATLLLLLGAGALVASGKKKSNGAAAIKPIIEPEIALYGDCEAWSLLPSPQEWVAGYLQVRFDGFIEGASAQPTGAADLELRGPQMVVPAQDIVLGALAQAPLQNASPEFPVLGSLCPLAGPDIPVAMAELYNAILPIIEEGLIGFNTAGSSALPIPGE